MPGPNPDKSTAGTDGGLRERKKARTRREIQRQTLRLMEEYGFAETTVEQIAQAADISQSTFFRYFRNKEEAAVTDFLNEEMFLHVIDAPPELGLIDALIHGIRATIDEISDEDWHYAQVRGALVQSVPELRRGVMELLTVPLRFSVEIATRRLDLPEHSLEARLYGGVIVGGLLGLLLPTDGGGLEQPMPESRELVMDTLEQGLRSLGEILVLPEP